MKRFADLIESALEEQGTAVVVILHPELGPAATVAYANRPFAEMAGQAPGTLEGVHVQHLRGAVGNSSVWPVLMAALAAGRPTQDDFVLRPRTGDRWLSLRLTFRRDPASGANHAILTARDITELRRATAREEESGRLLAAIFSRIGAPVLLVTAEGAITMWNPAMQTLLGCTPEEMRQVKVQDLPAPEYAQAMQAARAKQFRDGERFDMRIDILAKGGVRVPVRVSSVLLRDADQRLRVVTLIPEPVPAAVPRSRGIGELRAVSLAAFRSAFGAEWERIATRAMMVAENIIRRRLRPEDVLSRSDDHNFVIWFDSTDQDRNESVLAGTVREIRLRFLTEFGEQAAANVSATLVSREQAPPVRKAAEEQGPWSREWLG